MISSLPNLLTLSRIFVIPALIGTFFFVEGAAGNWLSLGLFAAAGITDFLDGYLARQWGIQTRLGRFLDPVADKLLVVAVILLLIAFDRIAGWTVLAAIVIVCREILVSGLREFLAEIRVGMPVSALAKWKTTVQILALGFLLAGEAGDALLPSTTIGTWGLWIAAALTLYTGYDYLRAGLDHMRHEDDGGGGESGSP
ncbi:MAG TPA: CDP-diacylglycerol--glycerol-3-phosphate 3-phosphatidyltransferase [Alphaproteobacteria bacterium]|jgi:CDP-diacylglycerol--glycerol-3-phosphate 3-phosphatidyltransferase|nr:CDP-diacylglycerol--glycerol-3-phosphate 3-phosphatidyltransferase [Alphaproteobacteria bacterium]MDP6271547.1 CDP-diacylglycerol--glycerol-3-phosphate 3-phosphatidyltransferase [Alphaproteobacteria bacterium]MDP7428497.1 CDP-diacylglycerol--glycerol-3-phosphate 3-phosphatidyltransferase [Alphaproteobacteria bacterium]HJM51466.1 CDP-diacylglycerol--glycerol-3-phosphate 3-phosphatidyltransferase [Alphaproteobacteria bacterium]